MQLKTVKRTPNELKLEIIGEGHTLCNLLESVLLEDKNVEFAGYNIDHPLISNAMLYLRMKGNKKPEKALKETVDKILKREKELSTEFNKALKEWQDKRKKSSKSTE